MHELCRDQYEYSWTGSKGETVSGGGEVKFQGRGFVQFSDGGEIGGNWRDGNRQGRCSTTCPAAGILQLVGNYKNNKLRGVGKVQMEDERIIQAEFR